MDKPLLDSLFITIVGMAVVFLAMALIYLSMRLLTAMARDKPRREAVGQSVSPDPHDERKESRLRAAAIAVALARARLTTEETVEGAAAMTSWGEFYRHRQLRPGGRRRIPS